MADWPGRLAALVAGAPTKQALVIYAVNEIRRTFDASIGGMLLMREDGEKEAVCLGLRATHHHEYMVNWRSRDPVLSAALAARVSVRDADLHSSNGRVTAPFCVDFARRVGASSYMVAPLYGPEGEIIGTLHISRQSTGKPFDVDDAKKANAFSAFLSTMLAVRPSRKPALASVALAPREHQIALMAAQGLSNPSIAGRLGLSLDTVKGTLTRVYQKANVANRNELARVYARSGWV